MTDKTKLPVHVGLIMDGNGRWAKKRLLPRSVGHKAGMDNMIRLADYAQKTGIKYLTLYVLSTENLQRPQDELDGLYDLIRKYFTANVKKIIKKGAGIKVIGDISVLPDDVCKTIKEAEALSPKSPEFVLVFAINYGSRAEIVRAVNSAIEKGEKLDEEGFEKLLYTGDIPHPDLIIRTGGEIRLSNFLTYQAAYAELYFTDVLFPDFSEKQFDIAIDDYLRRDRRFGNV